ncbi:Arginine decarboxylase [Hibiscus syriacus]|uniref:Arginine decarboxylase n=1 Tax=Hibiscus syriacus TaxID=106335 RepID=A0A6A2WX90_HIBSY|nr:arginine decarboxylase-like [Hibiscus syriacus]KAE8654336.1 Arginine decarboxylase [Hibiscus syriacus]
MGMPTLACCVDAAVAPPGYAGFIAGDSSLAVAVPFSSSTTATAASDDSISTNWSPAHSAALYRIDSWGAPYFAVNDSGNITVRPYGASTSAHQGIDLLKVVKKVSDPKSADGLGLQFPLIVRFPDVLKNRLESLQSAFELAIQAQGYESHYQGVYPVKCNQDRFVVEDVVKFGSPFRFGLEAGSKPELLLAMNCLCKGNPEAVLVCNGFKDAEYISLALLARKLALNTVIVLEQEEEVRLVIDISRKLSVRPVIGLRAKLRTKHSGHFGSTSGEKGKFGLTTNQILRVVKELHGSGMLDCLQLLHFHIGSQIPSTALLQDGVGEGAQIYSELVRLGANMKVIDIGGGLGIDYDGSKSGNSDLSVSYGLEEYASAVVNAIRVVCDRKSIKHPIICSESGRAIVSHHSILIFEAMGATALTIPAMNEINIPFVIEGLSEDARADYWNLSDAAMRHDNETCLFYADQLKQRCVEQFKEGTLGIEQLGAVDGLFDLVSKMIGGSEPARTYLVNLSIFTSIPDFWSIGQVFPIVPIHRLDERPVVKSVLSDLTCDSDGKIDKFIGGETSLPLHELDSGCGGGVYGRYYLGMFLGGAYEEALGGVHNLFGGPSVVTVLQSDGPQSFAVTRAMPGSSCGDILRAKQHEPELMFNTLKHRAEEFCRFDAGALSSSVAHSLHNMPYLQLASSCSLTAFNNSGFYYCNQEDYNDGALVESGASEDEQWSYCVA